MRSGKLVIAMMFVGSAAFAGFARAEGPAMPAPVQAQASKLADDAVKAKDEMPEIQHLRETRHKLEEAKDAFDKDAADAKGHRKEILEGIDKAIKACDDEIEEYKADMKK